MFPPYSLKKVVFSHSVKCCAVRSVIKVSEYRPRSKKKEVHDLSYNKIGKLDYILSKIDLENKIILSFFIELC